MDLFKKWMGLKNLTMVGKGLNEINYCLSSRRKEYGNEVPKPIKFSDPSIEIENAREYYREFIYRKKNLGVTLYVSGISRVIIFSLDIECAYNTYIERETYAVHRILGSAEVCRLPTYPTLYQPLYGGYSPGDNGFSFDEISREMWVRLHKWIGRRVYMCFWSRSGELRSGHADSSPHSFHPDSFNAN